MNRFYIDQDPGETEELFLTEEDVHHARDVLRLKPGQPVEIILSGRRYAAVIADISLSYSAYSSARCRSRSSILAIFSGIMSDGED